MTTRKITVALIVLVTLALGLWDVFAEVHAGDPATISRVLLDGAHRFPVIPFAFGFLMGHLFFSQEKLSSTPP